MNPLDIGVIAVIGLSAVFAFARGFVREALSIVAWVGAGFAALYAYSTVFAMTDPMVHNQLLQQLIAGPGVFLVALVILTIVTGMIARQVRAGSLSSVDRTLGFVFGLARGALLLSLAFLLLETVQPADWPPWIKEAKSMPYLQQGADMIRTVLPKNWREKTSTTADELIQKAKAQTGDDLAKAAIRAYSNPTAPAQPGNNPAPAPNYKPSDQKELDRIINNNQR